MDWLFLLSIPGGIAAWSVAMLVRQFLHDYDQYDQEHR
jgi:hypothetical protein